MRADERVELGCRRIRNILQRLPIVSMRTLEQKISDAGPGHQRVDPHILTESRKKLEESDIVKIKTVLGTPWYRLSITPEEACQAHLDLVEPVIRQLHRGKNGVLIGQALELAVFQALRSDSTIHFIGGFELNSSKNTWRKIEPRMISGQALTGGRNLDFILVHSEAGRVGIEVKNTREWIYPNSEAVRDLIDKCYELDAVPVMICRRYAYVTYSLLHRCGVLLHQNYNQLFPESLSEVAEKARHKNLLGYHDIRVGIEPDQRLRRFIGKLPSLLPEARDRFDGYKDLLCDFASGDMEYKAFAARSRRREQGLPEDFDSYEDF